MINRLVGEQGDYGLSKCLSFRCIIMVIKLAEFSDIFQNSPYLQSGFPQTSLDQIRVTRARLHLSDDCGLIIL